MKHELRRALLFAGLVLALFTGGQSATLTTQQEFAATARDTLWLTADTLHADPGGPADTLGPVYIFGAPKVRIAAGWKGDSLAYVVEASVDLVNWVTIAGSATTVLGSAGAYGINLHMILQDFIAAAVVPGSAVSANYPWVRVRFITLSTSPAYVTALQGSIACVR